MMMAETVSIDDDGDLFGVTPMDLATIDMPKHQGESPGLPPRKRGRPKGGGKITFRYALTASPEMRTWMAAFLEHLGESEVSDVLRASLRSHAKATGFRPPPAL